MDGCDFSFSNMLGSASNEMSEGGRKGVSVCVCERSVSMPSQNSFLFNLLHLLHIFSRVMTITHHTWRASNCGFTEQQPACDKLPENSLDLLVKFKKIIIIQPCLFNFLQKKTTQNFGLVPARTNVLLHLPSTFPFGLFGC